MQFIGEIDAGLDPGVCNIVFADELKMYFLGSIAEIRAVLQRLSENAGCVLDWARDNGLPLSVD